MKKTIILLLILPWSAALGQAEKNVTIGHRSQPWFRNLETGISVALLLNLPRGLSQGSHGCLAEFMTRITRMATL